ncbi:hypothetical protein CEXT_216531 [Caerostris extrusa]|uniref:C2H2-type domain-containing protein n=1 Tax=Caerostris extrusa TaxID=172846 RepID=A0AAV4QN83_CAEEX|nr:hypothetical protein CEXT_216531 [Caerostris extrusa]
MSFLTSLLFCEVQIFCVHFVINFQSQSWTLVENVTIFTYVALYKETMLFNKCRKVHHCSFCEYTTYKTSHLKDHEAIHLGYKPHQCEMCSKTFVQKINLKRHMIVHYKH